MHECCQALCAAATPGNTAESTVYGKTEPVYNGVRSKSLVPSVEELLSKSIAELREFFLERERAVPEGFLEALENDSRNGAKQLAVQIRRRRLKNRREGQRLHHLLRFE